MSGIVHNQDPRTDARVRRTRDRLAEALMALIEEKPFDAITVQEVLDLAGVGRSTFYAHFESKDDLFRRDVEEFFAAVASQLWRKREASDRVAPVREYFAHVAEVPVFYRGLQESGRIHEVNACAQLHFAQGIERRLAELPRARGLTAEQRAALAQGYAAALLALLTWWLERGTPGTAAQMDELFHRMVWAGANPR